MDSLNLNLDFDKIKSLRDTLIISLKHWKSDDGFYRSAPPLYGDIGPPSFTNTGVVLQAFNESGNNHLAHDLADSLLCYSRDRGYTPYPHEKDDKGEKGHVVCNSWAVFGILDCYPNRVNELKKICDWFLNTQKEDFSWDLIPREKTRYPIFTAYSLVALVQFYDCYKKNNDKDMQMHERIKIAIENGIEYLFKTRSSRVKQKELLLWPASLDHEDQKAISFCTSALCMHVIAKASKIFNRDDWWANVERTIINLLNGFDDKHDVEFRIAELEIKVWDQIHVNESSLNYFMSFFAPISIVTLLAFIRSEKITNNGNYLKIISYTSNWISNNLSHLNGNTGVKGNSSMTEIKTWSTALAVIVLSRLIEYRYELYRLALNKANHSKDITGCHPSDKVIDDIAQKINQIDIDVDSRKKYVTGINIFVMVVGSLIYVLFADTIQANWSNTEGKITLAVYIITFIIAIIGINVGKIRNGIILYIHEKLHMGKIIYEIREIIENYKA